MQTNRFEVQLAIHAERHRHLTHRLTLVGASFALISLIALATSVGLGTAFGRTLTLGHLAALALVGYSARFDWKLALFVGLLLSALVPVAELLPAALWSATALAGAAVCAYDLARTRPFAFDVRQLLLAPLFLVARWVGNPSQGVLRFGPAPGGPRVG